jgi:class III poly(R)-hydroxyalkanoic acid synthase PhaE subunit
MTESAPPLEQTWFEASQRFWEAWNGGFGPQRAEPPASGSPFSPEFLQALVDQGTSFVRFGEEVAAALQRSADALGSQDEWQRLFQASAEAWRKGMGSAAPDLAGLGTAWTLPLDTWRRTFSSASVFPGDFLEQVKVDSWTQATEDLHRHLERFLSVPGLGYTREWQEQGQELARLGLNYQRALQEYAALFRQLNADVLERLQRKLGELTAANQPITTLRGLYDVWVDCSEAAYLDLVSTDAYAESYGKMVNALMALKRHGRNMVDEGAGALGLPTRHDLSTLQRRHQELRRELAGLRTQRDQSTSAGEQIAALQEEMASLRARLDASGAPPTPTRQPAAAPRRTRRRRPSGSPKAKGG